MFQAARQTVPVGSQPENDGYPSICSVRWDLPCSRACMNDDSLAVKEKSSYERKESGVVKEITEKTGKLGYDLR